MSVLHTHSASIGQNAVATKRSGPPSGNATAIASPAEARRTHEQRRAHAPGVPAGQRRPERGRARKRPATGLAQVAANASTPAATAHPARARLPVTASACAEASGSSTVAGPASELPISMRIGPHSPTPPATPSAARARRGRAGAVRTAPPTAERTAHAHAPTAQATPSVNGIRPMITLVTMPLANSHVAARAAAGVRAAPAASQPNASTAATPAIAPTARGPTSPASGGKSTE